MKYIDADKLIAEIRIIQQSLENRDVRLNQVKKIRTECMTEFCKCIFDVISSLQQEQPEVDEPEYGPYARQYPKSKVSQEQPEVDLEKIIGQTYCDGSVADTSDMDHVDYENIARHFYELGLKARKEK